MRILVVEDDRKVASFIRKGLEEEGHAVEVAGDGAAAIERATDGAPVGRDVKLSIVRDGNPVTLSACIEALDPKESAQAEGGEKAKPALGLAVQPLTPALAQQPGVRATQGLVVQNVQEGSPAAEAGFERGDVIVEVNKTPVRSVAELRETVAKHGKGSPMLFRVQRQDSSLFLTVAAW